MIRQIAGFWQSMPAGAPPAKRAMRREFCRFLVVAMAVMSGAWTSACQAERPPNPTPAGAASSDGTASDASAPPHFAATSMTAVITYAGDRGEFRDTSKWEDVPPEARKLVRIKILDGVPEPAGSVWITNLNEPAADGTFALKALPRGEFEEYALGQGRASKVAIAAANDEGPVQPGAASEDIVLYKTAWCGACKQLAAYLDRKGVKYSAKDIEASPEAARELAAKAKRANVPMGSVPMIDVRGQLMVGFDRARLEQML